MLRRLHFRCFCLVLALAPLPFASNRAWAWTVLALLVGLLCLTWPLAVRGEKDVAPIPPARFAVPGVLFGGALLWGWVQTLSIVPESWHHPIWAQTASALGQPVEGRIALDPLAAESFLLRLLAYAGVFWLACQHAASGRRAHALVDAGAAIGAVYAAYGLAVFLSGAETILGYDKWAYQGFLTSTFVNRNHFAAFAGICALCAAAAIARRAGGGWRLARGDAGFYLVTLCLILAAMPGTGSRAGLAATAAGFAAWLIWRAETPVMRKAALVGIVVAAIAAALYVVFDWRDDSTLAGDVQARWRIVEIAAAAVADRPWLGHGMGSFPDVAAAARTPVITQTWTEVHNVYLELAVELGLPAALAMLAAMGWCVAVCARARTSSTAMVAFGVSVLVALHSIIDFPTQMPAVAAIWAALLGAGCGRAWSRA